MLRKRLFVSAHQVGDRKFHPTYKTLLENQWKTYGELKKEQEKKMNALIHFAYRNVPYYNKLFKDLNLNPDDIKSIEDLQKLPVINKSIIKENWNDFNPINLNELKYYNRSTSGTTGTPFGYRISKFDRFLSGALLYRGWGYAGYKLGDRMVFFGGRALDIGKKSNLISKIHETVRNIRKLSSFDMNENNMRKYVDIINSFKPKFIRGYASSIYFLSNWVEKHQIRIYSPFAIFTTAGKLYPNMRKKIEYVFSCNVYDGYGLHDGGVSAYECSEHCGFHIDMERSVMEIVDEDGNQLKNGEGKIIATSLCNYAMPFIRYDTSDIGHIIDDACGCGRPYELLKELVGRSVDILVTPEGKNVNGWIFVMIFWEYDKVIKEYQITQEKLDTLVIKIVPEDDFDKGQLNKIREIIKITSPAWNVDFKFVDKIERTEAEKYKFIINKLEK
ncbi:Phenylacetate-coenzyme A ligase [subsurface metagenome]